MTRRITAAAVASIGAMGVAGVATADSGRSAKTYKASLAAVQPAAGTMYLWHVHEGDCAATGAPVDGWTYRTQVGANGTLTSNGSGNANTRGKSATFSADPTKSYSVNVHVSTLTNGLAPGTIIACGDLKASKAKKAHPPQAKGPKP